tara:strand:+ start:985 stop:2082 length:1098 start_codon:yes stop_codon:yes gene_type:complete
MLFLKGVTLKKMDLFMKYKIFLLSLFLIIPAYSQASDLSESQFEREARVKLQDYSDSLAAVEAYLDRRLKGQKTQVMHPEMRDDVAVRVLDGYYPEEYNDFSLTNHSDFTAQIKYTRTQLGSFMIQVKEGHSAAAKQYDSLVETHGKLKIFFREVSHYKAIDFKSKDIKDSFQGGKKEHAHMLHLAAHETWKRSVLTHLKFSVYAHNLIDLKLPDYLASGRHGFMAHRYAMIPAVLHDRSHIMYANLSFSLKGKSYKNAIRFVYDTGATHTCLPFSLLETWGIKESDLDWNEQFFTANGIGEGTRLKTHHLQLHAHVVFFGMDVSINRKGTSCLLGTDISDQFLQEIRKGTSKEFMAIQNNWRDL